MNISDKRKAGDLLGRDGISERITLIAQSIVDGGYKNAIEQAGRIHQLVEAATCDDYWNGKANTGKWHEQALMQDLTTGHLKKDNYTDSIKPTTKE
jgi:hypothetical protein